MDDMYNLKMRDGWADTIRYYRMDMMVCGTN